MVFPLKWTVLSAKMMIYFWIRSPRQYEFEVLGFDWGHLHWWRAF